MSALARFAVRKPRVVVIGWLISVIVLGFASIGVGDRLLPSSLLIPGTETARWAEIRADHFGSEGAIVLVGGQEILDEEGPKIADALADLPGTAVLSPWTNREAEGELRPAPTRAVIAVDTTIAAGQNFLDAANELRSQLAEIIPPSIQWHLSGLGPLGVDINTAVVEAVHTAELLAAPALLLVLLLVFRSAVAAAIPLAIGIGTVVSANGVVGLLTRVIDLDATVLSLASLMGLALGVDYSLLMVTRFREQLAAGDPVQRAAATAAHTAGRTVAFAGTVLVAIMTVSFLLSPGAVLLSASLGAIVSTVFGLIGGVFVTPAVLCTLGERVNRLSIGGSPIGERGRLEAIVGKTARRPGLTAAVVLAVLLVCALPATSLDLIPPDPEQLPEGSPGLVSYRETRASGLGPPIEVVIKANDGALTSAARLHAIAGFETRVSQIPDVRGVFGPGRFAPEGRSDTDGQAAMKSAERDVAELNRGLGKASGGVGRLRDGITKAATGAQRLETGIGEAQSASGRLAEGSARAKAGAIRIADATDLANKGVVRARREVKDAHRKGRRFKNGTDKARSGSRRLDQGAERLTSGINGRLTDGLHRLERELRLGKTGLGALGAPARIADRELRSTVRELDQMKVGKADPGYGAAVRAARNALAAVAGLVPSLALAAQKLDEGRQGVGRLVDGAEKLGDGARRLSDGTGRLASGLVRLDKTGKRILDEVDRASNAVDKADPKVDRLSRGAGELVAALGRISEGNGRLAGGLGRGRAGLARLAGGLQNGRSRSRPLEGGLSKESDRVSELTSGAGLGGLSRRSPGFLDSSYLTLAALDGANAADKDATGFLIDVPGGGQVGRVLVLPDVPTNDPRMVTVVQRTSSAARDFAAANELTSATGGDAPQLVDYDRVTTSRMPWLILLTALVTYLMLVPVLRSLYLPLVAVLLNLLTVAVGFGVLTILFVGENPLLGGAGALDVVAASGIFAITFALSIDYQVFLLARMREEFVRTQDNEQAIVFGIRRTAGVVTGAAAIMLAVFVAFGFANYVVIKQFGIGLATVVFIDATLVRLALLPAVMRLMGQSTWWLPVWLDRRLPVLDVEGARFQAQQKGLARSALKRRGAAFPRLQRARQRRP